MDIQKIIRSSFLNKNKEPVEIIIGGNKKKVKSGDVLHVSMPTDESMILRGRFIDISNDGKHVHMFIISPNFNMIDVKVPLKNIIGVSEPN